jgi:hypothetical protein
MNLKVRLAMVEITLKVMRVLNLLSETILQILSNIVKKRKKSNKLIPKLAGRQAAFRGG